MASCNGYPNHFTKYCGLVRMILLSKMVSTSYSSWLVLGIKIAGGDVGHINFSNESL